MTPMHAYSKAVKDLNALQVLIGYCLVSLCTFRKKGVVFNLEREQRRAFAPSLGRPRNPSPVLSHLVHESSRFYPT